MQPHQNRHEGKLNSAAHSWILSKEPGHIFHTKEEHSAVLREVRPLVYEQRHVPKKIAFSPFFSLPLSSFSLFCFCYSNLWCSAEDKSPEQLRTLAPRLEQWHIAHIFFIHFQKYPCDGFFCMNYCTCLAEQHSSLYPGQLHRHILPSVPAETSHRKRLLQKSIPCSEQLWTILVTVSKSLKRSSGNVLLYNRLGPDTKQKASTNFRVWFKSQTE